MCNFKSGIILKNKVVLAPEGNESHSGLLERLGIEENRKVICIEKDEKIFELGKNRVMDYQKEKEK